MSRRIRRTSGGQFAAGQSGNPAGARLRKPAPVLTPIDLAQIIMKVAGEIVGTLHDKPVTRYEIVARSLAKGDSTNRLAAQGFLEVVQTASHFLERTARRTRPGEPGPC